MSGLDITVNLFLVHAKLPTLGYVKVIYRYIRTYQNDRDLKGKAQLNRNAAYGD